MQCFLGLGIHPISACSSEIQPINPDTILDEIVLDVFGDSSEVISIRSIIHCSGFYKL
jgi:hypothetical protein